MKRKCHFAFLPIQADDTQADPQAPSRVLLAKDGPMDWEGAPEFHLDEESAETVIADFRRKGNKVPIDYHHATLKQEKGQCDKAPACGWVTDLEYVKGEGLFGKTTWNKEAAEEIRTQKYAYHSPVMWFNEDGRPFELHSFSVTNRPRTRELIELLQAAEAASGEQLMPKDKKKLAAAEAFALLNKARLACAQEEMEDEVAVGMSITPEQVLMVKLADALGLDPQATIVELLQAAVDKLGGDAELGGEGDGEAEAEAAEAVKLVAAELGVTGKPKGAELVEAIKTMNAKSGQYAGVAKKLAAAESRLEKIEGESAAIKATAEVSRLIEEGRLLPDSKKVIAAAEALWTTDPKQAAAVYNDMPVICEPGQLTDTKPLRVAGGTDERSQIIAAASAEFDTNPPDAQGVNRKSWVTACLRDKGLRPCSKDEAKKLEEAA